MRTEWGEVPSRTILDCDRCEAVITAPMIDDDEGIYLCPHCGDALIETDYVRVDDVFALVEVVQDEMVNRLGH